MKRIVAIGLLAPLVYIVAFYIYAAINPGGSCNGGNPGLCLVFGAALLIVVPLAIIATPASLILFILHHKDRKKAERDLLSSSSPKATP